jgi:hypothetical protein
LNFAGLHRPFVSEPVPRSVQTLEAGGQHANALFRFRNNGSGFPTTSLYMTILTDFVDCPAVTDFKKQIDFWQSKPILSAP